MSGRTRARELSGDAAVACSRALLRWALAALLLFACANAGATARDPEARRFPQTRITASQWYTYMRETQSKQGAVLVERDRLLCIVVRNETAIYFFTTRNHPAYPAAVRRAVVSRGTRSFVHTSGYYAGSRVAFLEWMESFRSEDRELQRGLGTSQGAGKLLYISAPR